MGAQRGEVAKTPPKRTAKKADTMAAEAPSDDVVAPSVEHDEVAATPEDVADAVVGEEPEAVAPEKPARMEPP